MPSLPWTPMRQPAAEAAAPRSAASVVTMRVTWAGVAPTVRSSASSRRRCAMEKAKVPETTKTETKQPISAMIASRVATSSRAAARLAPAVPLSLPASVCTVRGESGRAARIASATVPAGTPGSANTARASASAGAGSSSASASSVRKAVAAPSGAAGPVRVAMPTTRTSSRPWAVSSASRSPTRAPASAPGAGARTTSPEPAGSRPSRSR